MGVFLKCLGILLMLVLSAKSYADFELIAVHPNAVSEYPATQQAQPHQTSHLGRQIKELKAFNGRIYIGYGQNDGLPPPSYQCNGWFCPISIRYIDTATDTLSGVVSTLQSQGVYTMKVMNNSLFILAEDPDGQDDYIKCTVSTCTQENLGFQAHHLFSAYQHGSDIYIAGSGNSSTNGIIWRSSDNGDSWSIDHTIYKTNSIPCCVRGLFLGAIGNTVYTQGYQYDSTSTQPPTNWMIQPHSFGKNSSWTQNSFSFLTTYFAGGEYTIETEGHLVYRSGFLLYKSPDGSSKSHIDIGNVRDFTLADDGYVYALLTDDTIKRSKNLISWSNLGFSHSQAHSIEVLNGKVYIGTTQGEIYMSEINIPISPILYLLLSD